jgi:lysozyme family protein
MADFRTALNKTLQHEGGYANIPGDNGGESYAGISRNNWPAWRGWAIIDKAKPLKRNQKLKDKQLVGFIDVFYYEHFWKPVQGEKIKNPQIAGFLFDFYVNSGYHAIKAIQRLIKVKDDGLIGSQTLAAINAADPDSLFAALKSSRLKFVKDIAARKPDQGKFLEGWQNRINSFE